MVGTSTNSLWLGSRGMLLVRTRGRRLLLPWQKLWGGEGTLLYLRTQKLVPEAGAQLSSGLCYCALGFCFLCLFSLYLAFCFSVSIGILLFFMYRHTFTQNNSKQNPSIIHTLFWVICSYAIFFMKELNYFLQLA